MIVARPLSPAEDDLLTGNESAPLRFMLGDKPDVELKQVQAPANGWSHASLEAVVPPASVSWDAYLGQAWIGSSEV